MPHPLRRPSTGSLSSLARSQDRPPNASPSGLDFLQPAIADLTDEAATLASNIAHLTELHDALGTFNENFAGFLYALKMNAFCVEWGEAPSDISFARLPKLVPTPPPQTQLQPTSQLSQSSSTPPVGTERPSSPTQQGDMTYATVYSSVDEPAQPQPKGRITPGSGSGSSGGVAKKPVNAGATAANKKAQLAAKKKRELEIASIIDTLPLEYRGSQPTLRKQMEKVISVLMEQPSGLAMKSIVSMPDLPQTQVNKCLIALVGKKVVTKTSIGGTAFYKWAGAY